MYKYNGQTYTLTAETGMELLEGLADVRALARTRPINIQYKDNPLGSIEATPTPDIPWPASLGKVYNTDNGYRLIHFEVPLQYTTIDIPGVCMLRNGVLIINESFTYPAALAKEVVGCYTRGVQTMDTAIIASMPPSIYNILYIMGLPQDVTDRIKGIPTALPQNPREAINIEQELKGLFSDKLSNVILKKLK